MCVCVCVFLDMVTVHSGPTACYIKRQRRRGRIWRLASMSWRRPMNYGRVVVVWRPLPAPTGVNTAAVCDATYWFGAVSPLAARAGISWMVVLLFLPDWLLFRPLTGWDWWDCGGVAQGLSHSNWHAHAHTHWFIPARIWAAVSGWISKGKFFSPVCLYYFFSLLYEKVAHETRRVKSNHAFCSVKQGCWFFGDLRICNCL